MSKEENKKPLVIPENCPPVKYPVLNGFSADDMKYIGMAALMAAVAALIQYQRTENIFIAFGIIIFVTAVASVLLGRDRNAENFIDKIVIFISYKKLPGFFLYNRMKKNKNLQEKDNV